MLQSFVIVLREGIEAFLIVAITSTYLQKTFRNSLLPAVTWGVVASIILSALLGYFLWITEGVNQPILEGAFGLITVFLVGTLVIQMWKIGPNLKKSMENDLSKAIAKPKWTAYIGVLLFTIIAISREGMEMVLLLFQVRGTNLVTGIILGTLAAIAIAFAWQRFGYLINWNRFFQITTVFLLLFIIQIAVQSFHEFTEAGIFPNSDFLHTASEPFSTEGVYGKIFGNMIFAGCGLWLLWSVLFEPSKKNAELMR